MLFVSPTEIPIVGLPSAASLASVGCTEPSSVEEAAPHTSGSEGQLC